MYADRKNYPLEKVTVNVSMEKKNESTLFIRNITLEGNLTEESRARLLEIANRCPVHTTLTHPINITTELQ
ncbi:MAG TPA: hypothetical protein DGG95_09630 [Cytophagales bacterium]|nr:hypothetical protein [Cytophagales bacterium]